MYVGLPSGSGGTGGRPSPGLRHEILAGTIGGWKQVQPCSASVAGVMPPASADAAATPTIAESPMVVSSAAIVRHRLLVSGIGPAFLSLALVRLRDCRAGRRRASWEARHFGLRRTRNGSRTGEESRRGGLCGSRARWS